MAKVGGVAEELRRPAAPAREKEKSLLDKVMNETYLAGRRVAE